MFTRHKLKENALALSLIASLNAKPQGDDSQKANAVTVEEALAVLSQLSARRACKDALH